MMGATEDRIKRVEALLRDSYYPCCRDDDCTCVGYERWDCVLGANPLDIAQKIVGLPE
jgi:hypothetical protein